MKKSREDTARTRERILASASRRFREGGFEGVSVKELMSEAGLTHGAFYAHFPSKEALMGAACTEALRETANRLPEAEGPDPEALAGFFDRYLTRSHVDSPARGCAITTLGAEAARDTGEVKQAFARGVETLLGRLAALAPGEDEAARRTSAITGLAEAVGALVLARAVEPGELQDAILAAARQHLLPPDRA